MISSNSNGQVKNVVQLQKKARARTEQGVFVVEGLKMFLEAPKDRLVSVFVSQSFYEKEVHKEYIKGVKFEIVEDRVFDFMSDTKTPQGILCIVRQFQYSLKDMIQKENPFLLILEDLQDPGNVGTIVRTGEGAGLDGVILSQNSVDIYNPKTIRATMGSIYRIPIIYIEKMEDILGELASQNITTYAAHLQGKLDYDEEDYRSGTAFFIGNESKGLSTELAKKADVWIKIPMEGKVESLNAAIASSVLMYEVHKQRKVV
jgi:rRNA methylases